MKFITAIILTALLSYAAGLFSFLPWYSFVVCALIVAVAVHQKAFKAFLSGFIALLILWGAIAFKLDSDNQHILATKVAAILPLGGNPYTLIAVTAFIGGLLAGMGSLTGSYLRRIKK
jgi:hypothetical protein